MSLEGLGLTGNIIIFTFCAVLVAFTSIFLSFIVDTIGKRTRFSGALVAGTVVALISSLPEFTMSLVNLFTAKPGEGYALANGNLIGGNLFRTLMLAVCCLLFIYSMKKAKTKFNQVFLIIVQSFISILWFFLMVFHDSFLAIPFNGDDFFGSWLSVIWFIVDIIAIGLYITNIIVMVKTDKNDMEGEVDEQTNRVRRWLMKTKLTNVFLLFGLSSIVIVGCAFTLGLNVDFIIGQLTGDSSEGMGFYASLFGGIVTSIPEIVTVITLLKIGNSEAAITDILGSNLFSCFILAFDDMITWNVNQEGWESHLSDLSIIEFWFIIELVFVGSILLINHLFINRKHKGLYYGLISTALLMCVCCYFLYVLQATHIIPPFFDDDIHGVSATMFVSANPSLELVNNQFLPLLDFRASRLALNIN